VDQARHISLTLTALAKGADHRLGPHFSQRTELCADLRRALASTEVPQARSSAERRGLVSDVSPWMAGGV
jgi:hypothetical protein